MARDAAGGVGGIEKAKDGPWMMGQRFATQALILVQLLTGCVATRVSPETPGRFEGEPILLNAPDLDSKTKDYLARVSQMIRKKWSYPCVKDEATGKCEYKPARLVIDFGIFEDGSVGHVAVRESSGMDIYDERTVKAVRDASPFPRIPPEMMARAKPGSAGVTIRAPFRYKLVTCGDGAACD